MTVTIKNKAQLEEAREELELLKKARRKILAGAQSYTLGSNQLNRANLAEVSKEISAYETAIDAYETYGTTKRRGKRAVPLG